ncbi:MAG: nucleoid-associated protein [Bacteroidia bacterium]|nr:nucleoid-associated protein [Bacteroidia bacterium]NNJ55646.1 nucleoid-associated protein [Bacteroidia bacterium]
MQSFNETKISNLYLHFVGNQFHDEPLTLGQTKLAYNEEVETDLITYFTSSFKGNEFFQLHHESDLELNEVYSFASKIFESPEELHSLSVSLAKHLYEQSSHPKIKGGEFYVAFLEGCILEGEIVDAIGLFKTENKDRFLKIANDENEFMIDSQEGININKLDKGCIIFNTNKRNGYVLSVLDNTNKGNDAKFWFDDFLHVKQREDAYYQTESAMKFAKEFITKELPEQFEATKADQADLLNKSAQYFKEQEEFDLSEFANVVIQQPEIIESFNDYKTSYQQDRAVAFKESFDINDSAVKKKASVFKSVIKLDKNFHIYVHGDRTKIEQGTDESGRKFYTLFYDQEN